MRHIKRWLITGLLVCAGLVSLSACGFPGVSSTSKDTIRIASQNTTEQQIMAYMVQGMIEHYSNLDTTIINNLGSGTVSFNALKQNQADISGVRYIGTDLTTILGDKADRNSKRAAQTVTAQFNDKYNMTYFKSYGFSDTYAFMVSQETAKKWRLNTVSDMAKVANKMNVGIDQIWLNRKGDGYDGFQKVYGFSFGEIHPMQIGLVYDAVAAKKMDAVLGYSTDGRISSYHLKILKDDKKFFPPYDASPVATNAILKKHPELRKILNRMVGKIDLKTMQRLNYQVDNDLIEPEVAARQYLKKRNYFKGGDD